MNNLPFTDPVIIFALVMTMILIAPLAMHRMRMPGLIGLIVAGAIVGPSALHLLERDQTIELLGTVGLLYLMFMAGLSMDLNQFLREKTKSLSFGFLSFMIPQIAGILVGLHVLNYSLLSSVLLGSIVGSHTLLAYPIAKRLGINKNPAVTMSLGGTIVTDALALTVLAVVVAMNAGEIGTAFWFQFLGSISCFIIVVVFGLPMLGKWFFRNVQDSGDSDFTFLLVVLFFAAVLSKLVGLAPIVGAFVAGLSMNRLVPESGPLMNRIQFVGEALFIPFFLISVGMLVDFGVIFGSLEVWWTAICFTALVLAGKTTAAFVAKVFAGQSLPEMLTVAGLTIPQAAATLAVTLVGFDLGFFDRTAVNAVVLLMLLTCLYGTIFVERFGRQVALQEDARPFVVGDAPQRILVPLANENTADRLMDVAFMIRQQGSAEPVYPLTVARDYGDVQAQVAQAEKILGAAVIHAASADIPVLPVTRVDLHIAHGILRAIRERRITGIVLGWNGYVTTSQRILGSVLDELIERSLELILICRFTEMPLNTTQRVVLIIPRFAEREPGFPGAIVAIKQLVAQLGTELMIFVREDIAEMLEGSIQEIKPKTAIQVHSLSSWAQLFTSLKKVVKDDDLLVLMSTRIDRISWTPEIDRLPKRLASRFEANNFITVFPSENRFNVGLKSDTDLIRMLSEERMLPEVEANDLEGAIATLLASHFQDQTLDYLTRGFVANAVQNSTEVRSGLALFHRHVSPVKKPMIFIAKLDQELEVPGIRDKIKLLVIFLSPLETEPERHLQYISLLARTLNRTSVHEKLLASKTSSEMKDSFSKES